MRPHHEAIRPTTIIEAPRLSKRLGAHVVIASETFQWTGSFKFRAAYNVALNVPNEHIIAASSGNFGQALAYACQLTGKRCTVVMPHDSARVKVEAVRDYGATVDLINVREISRSERVQQLASEPAKRMSRALMTTRSSSRATQAWATNCSRSDGGLTRSSFRWEEAD